MPIYLALVLQEYKLAGSKKLRLNANILGFSPIVIQGDGEELRSLNANILGFSHFTV